MLLYWGMFTVGFSIGAIFSFITFAAKRPEEKEYETFTRPRTTNNKPATFVLIDKRQQPEEKIPQLLAPFTSKTTRES